MHKAREFLHQDATVFVHGTATEPRALVEHWSESPEQLSGVRLLTSFVPGINTRNLAGLAKGLHVVAFMNHAGYAESESLQQLTALRYSYSQVRQYLADLKTLDCAFVQVAPARNGHYSTGVSAALIPTAVKRASKVCLIVNDQMPVPADGYTIAAERADGVVHVSRPLIDYPAGAKEVDEVSAEVGRRVCTLIRDGDTVQAGIGSIPNALFSQLTERRNLRVFSGMVSDSFARLYESGSLDRRAEHVFGMALGSHEFYRWLDEQDGFRVAGAEETHSRDVIASIESFVAVNSALSVSLNGTVNAERIGSRCVSGPGGLPDYAAGASRSFDGRSIIALASTNSKGTVSRIVPTLADPLSQTLPPEHVTHVVTEHGIADLRGASIDERAERLIAVAAPEFRRSLLDSR